MKDFKTFMIEQKDTDVTFYTGINETAWNKIWSKKKLIDKYTNVTTDPDTAEEFSWGGGVVEIIAPLSVIVGAREDDYYDDSDWIDVSKYSLKQKKNLLIEYSLFLLDLYPYKNKIKIKKYNK